MELSEHPNSAQGVRDRYLGAHLTHRRARGATLVPHRSRNTQPQPLRDRVPPDSSPARKQPFLQFP